MSEPEVQPPVQPPASTTDRSRSSLHPDDPLAIKRRAGRFAIVFFLSLALLAGLMTIVVLRNPHVGRRNVGTTHAAVGSQIPKLNLMPCVNANAPLVQSQVAGKVMLLNLWGTWCPPCLEEFPYLMKLRDKYAGDEDFTFVSWAVPEDDSQTSKEVATSVADFLRTEGTDLPVYCDPDRAQRVALTLSLRMETLPYPLTLVVDGQGYAVGIWPGFRKGDEKDVEGLIELLLQQARESRAKSP